MSTTVAAFPGFPRRSHQMERLHNEKVETFPPFSPLSRFEYQPRKGQRCAVFIKTPKMLQTIQRQRPLAIRHMPLHHKDATPRLGKTFTAYDATGHGAKTGRQTWGNKCPYRYAGHATVCPPGLNPVSNNRRPTGQCRPCPDMITSSDPTAGRGRCDPIISYNIIPYHILSYPPLRLH